MCVACQEFTIAPRQGVAYCLTSLAGTFAATTHQCLYSAGPGGHLCSVRLSTWATPALADIHDATNHDAGDGHRF